MTIFHVIKYNELVGKSEWSEAVPKELRMYILSKWSEFTLTANTIDDDSIMNFYKEVLTEYEGPL